MQIDRVYINAKKGELQLPGNSCEECRSVCEALCCSFYQIPISKQEFQSGKYQADQICVLSDKVCDKPDIDCDFKNYQIKKNPNGACIYLDENNLCRIHAIKPDVCREFVCSFKFSLIPQRKSDKEEINHQEILEKRRREINYQMVFVSHPQVKLHTVFLRKQPQRLILVKELISNCGIIYTEEGFNFPCLDEDKILWLIRCFDKKESLEKIKSKFETKYGNILSEKEFNEIIWILLKHHIIINPKILGSLLTGIGL